MRYSNSLASCTKFGTHISYTMRVTAELTSNVTDVPYAGELYSSLDGAPVELRISSFAHCSNLR